LPLALLPHLHEFEPKAKQDQKRKAAVEGEEQATSWGVLHEHQYRQEKIE
jgi:hypothetical protein